MNRIRPPLPRPRGEISAFVCDIFQRSRQPVHPPAGVVVDNPLRDEDLQLGLYLLYELHYRGFAGVSDEWEWSPRLIELRAGLEHQFVAALTERVQVPVPAVRGRRWLSAAVLDMIDAARSPSLSKYLERDATLAVAREYLVHRSAYHLKEADPYSWALPRCVGRPKTGLAQIQFDEYGSGHLEWNHAALFAQTMRAMGLDDSYGGYLDAIPGVTLATVNIISLFGLHRRFTGALLGHLAVTEMTSPEASRRIAAGLRRLNAPAEAMVFYDEHVEADAMHEALCQRDLLDGVAADSSELAEQVLFGVACMLTLDGELASDAIDSWRSNGSSLLPTAIAHC